jgi:hypothetical protein
MSDAEEEVVLHGRALRAVVRAAETPLVGVGVKKRLFGQLGLEELFELDLREYMDPEPILAPDIPAPPTEDERE